LQLLDSQPIRVKNEIPYERVKNAISYEHQLSRTTHNGQAKVCRTVNIDHSKFDIRVIQEKVRRHIWLACSQSSRNHMAHRTYKIASQCEELVCHYEKDQVGNSLAGSLLTANTIAAVE
jgi:hypothetical protein